MQEATTPDTSSIPRTILRNGNGDCPYGRSEEMGPPGFHDSKIRIYVEEMENVCPSSRSDWSLRTTNALTPTLARFL